MIQSQQSESADSLSDSEFYESRLSFMQWHQELLAKTNREAGTCRGLTFTDHDQTVLLAFRTLFPVEDVSHLSPSLLVSQVSLDKWAVFLGRLLERWGSYAMTQFKTMQCFSHTPAIFFRLPVMAATETIVRQDCNKPYGKSNSIRVNHLVWLAIESARNREGLNDEGWTTEVRRYSDPAPPLPQPSQIQQYQQPVQQQHQSQSQQEEHRDYTSQELFALMQLTPIPAEHFRGQLDMDTALLIVAARQFRDLHQKMLFNDSIVMRFVELTGFDEGKSHRRYNL